MSALRIEAFTFEFNEVQDRIRLSGNLFIEGEEVSFWVTRRLALRLLSAAKELVEKTSPSIVNTPSDHRSAMAEFEHESAQKAVQSSLQTHHKDANFKDAPMASEDPSEAIESNILSRVDISFKGKHYRLSFFVDAKNEAAAYSDIEYNQLHQILSLIHQGALKLDWGVGDKLFTSSTSATHTLQ